MSDTYQRTLLDQIRADELALADRIEAEARPSTMQTRGEAELAIKPRTRELQAIVYRTVQRYGPVTDERISELSGLNPNTCRPRRLELERAGRIVAAGYSKTRSGRKAVAWVMAHHG